MHQAFAVTHDILLIQACTCCEQLNSCAQQMPSASQPTWLIKSSPGYCCAAMIQQPDTAEITFLKQLLVLTAH